MSTNPGKPIHYKKIIPTTIKYILGNTAEFTEVPRVAVEVAGIIYDVEVHTPQRVVAKMSEQGISLKLQIPTIIPIDDIQKSTHDPMVLVLGCVKTEKQEIVDGSKSIKSWYKKWIKVDRIKFLNDIHEITNHYLQGIYVNEYRDNYEQIMEKLKNKPMQRKY